MAQSSDLSRRDFLSRSVMAAVAATLCNGCGGPIDFGGSTGPTSGGLATGFTVPLGSYPALASVGGIARVSGGSVPVAVVRVAADSFAAYSMVCPHQGSIINIQGSGFVCPNHGARFDAGGVWTGGQVTTNLLAIPVSYDAAAQTLTLNPAGAPTGGGGGGAGGPVGSGTLLVSLASFPILGTVGGIARVDGGGAVPVAVVRSGASSYAAFSLVCTHQGTTLNIQSGGFVCPNHGARFDAGGQWIGGQVTTNLVALPLSYDPAAGTLSIDLGGAPAGGGGGGEDDD